MQIFYEKLQLNFSFVYNEASLKYRCEIPEEAKCRKLILRKKLRQLRCDANDDDKLTMKYTNANTTTFTSCRYTHKS